MTEQQQPWTAPVPPPPVGYGQPSGGYGQPYPPINQPTMQPYVPPAVPAVPVPGVVAPYGYSDKSKTAAGLLQLLLSLVGVPGVGRLYAGHLGIGLGQLLGMFLGYFLLIFLVGFLIVPAIWIWSVIDGLVMLVGDPKDGQGRPLRP